MNDYFRYGARETACLKKADKRLGEIIDRIGEIKRETIGDLFAAIVHSIVGQQISTKAHRTVWQRICAALGTVTPQTVLSISAEELKNLGISFRKAEYIRSAAQKVASEELDLEALYSMSDDEVRSRLTQLRGIGVWSAEMLMLFSMQRPDILSYDDLAIRRGLRMIYHHRTLTREMFEKYRRRYSPFGSVASLYIWAAAGGAIEGMKDYKPERISDGKH